MKTGQLIRIARPWVRYNDVWIYANRFAVLLSAQKHNNVYKILALQTMKIYEFNSANFYYYFDHLVELAGGDNA
mgnify:CR=1 FL=1